MGEVYSIQQIRDMMGLYDRESIVNGGLALMVKDVVSEDRIEAVEICRNRARELDCLEQFNDSLKDVGIYDPVSLEMIFGPEAFVNINADLKEPIPEKEWVIEGICTRKECVLISGSSKSGKSYLMTNLAVTASVGGLWLGRFQCRRSRVLYINGENEINDARRRFHMVVDAMGTDPGEAIDMVSADGIVKYVQDLKECLTATIQKNKYGMVILDPLYCFYKGSELEAQDALAFVTTIKEICRDTGAAIVCVHHHSKGAGIYKNAASRASGSGMLQRVFSALLDVSEVTDQDLPDNQRGFEFFGAVRQASEFRMNLIFDFPLWRYDTQGLLPENANNKARTAAARSNNAKNRKAEEIGRMLPKVLEAAFSDRAKQDQDGEYITSGDVAEAFRTAGMDVSERTIERRLEDGIDGFKRDTRAGRRRYIRREEFKPAADSVVPGPWKTGSASVASVASVL